MTNKRPKEIIMKYKDGEEEIFIVDELIMISRCEDLVQHFCLAKNDFIIHSYEAVQKMAVEVLMQSVGKFEEILSVPKGINDRDKKIMVYETMITRLRDDINMLKKRTKVNDKNSEHKSNVVDFMRKFDK